VTEFVIVLCTAPVGGAEGIAKALVEERLAACVNVGAVRSYFIWEEKLCNGDEELLIIKTEKGMAERLMARIRELHSYQLPEMIMLKIAGGDERYLQWIGQSVG
jgi:periplasmic divalent cation tolerance protein